MIFSVWTGWIRAKGKEMKNKKKKIVVMIEREMKIVVMIEREMKIVVMI